MVEGVLQAKLNAQRLHRGQEPNLGVHGLSIPMTSLDPLQVATTFLHDTLDLKDITIDRAWMGTNSTLFLRFRTLEDQLRALWAKKRLTLLPST